MMRKVYDCNSKVSHQTKEDRQCTANDLSLRGLLLDMTLEFWTGRKEGE